MTSSATMTERGELELVTVPVQIRPGVFAQIRIPHDLTMAEAQKIARVAQALAVVEADAQGVSAQMGKERDDASHIPTA